MICSSAARQKQPFYLVPCKNTRNDTRYLISSIPSILFTHLCIFAWIGALTSWNLSLESTTSTRSNTSIIRSSQGRASQGSSQGIGRRGLGSHIFGVLLTRYVISHHVFDSRQTWQEGTQANLRAGEEWPPHTHVHITALALFIVCME